MDPVPIVPRIFRIIRILSKELEAFAGALFL